MKRIWILLLAVIVITAVCAQEFWYTKAEGLKVGTKTNGYTKLYVNPYTGIMTLAGGATIDNNTSTSVLNLTETTVRVTGAFDTTGNLTVASLDVGGGSGDTGVTITSAGLLNVDGAATFGSSARVDSDLDLGAVLLMSATNAAGGSRNPIDWTGTLSIMDGSDDLTVIDINLTNANHTGVSNTIQAIDIANITGDADATETAINIGTGWDAGITSGSLVNFNGGLAMDTSAFAVADTTGVVTLINGATIDNNASATVLTFTETTIQAAGILDVTGNSTLASVDIGGGSGGSGATITAAGAGTFDGVLAANAGITVDTTAFAVADTTGVVTLIGGATIDNNADNAILNLTETTVRATGILDVTGNSTLASLDVGGGAASTGVTIGADGAYTSSGTLTLGTDTAGTDLQLYSDVASANLLWDASDQRLEGSGETYILIGESGTGVTTAGGSTMIYGYGSHATNALTGELIGVRGNARVNVDSAAGTAIGGKFQAGNMSGGFNLATATGVYVDVVNKDSTTGAKTWTNARGYEVSMDLNQGTVDNAFTITNAYMFYGVYNLPTAGEYSTVTNGYGVYLKNEAVGGTGQALDAALYITDASMSGGIRGWDYGIDMSTAVPMIADIKLSGNDTGGLPGMIACGTATTDAGIVTQVGADTLWADGSLYIELADGGGSLWMKRNDVWTELTWD